jgi:protoporphyrinogen oxidase
MRIVIIGAGPTGLGAAYRLRELGHADWRLYEASDTLGGLARSYTDEHGFTYDIGGHVIASHYEYYDRLVGTLLGEDYSRIQREAWIYIRGRWVPYPFQNNIRHLPNEELLECLTGLIAAQREGRDPSRAGNFEEFNRAQFGDSISEHFMLPYNFKVWAHPPSLMSTEWIGERVAVVSVERILRNIIERKDDVVFGPHNWFKFPLYGGTGGLFSRYAPYVRENLGLNKRAVRVDTARRRVRFSDGDETAYDVLLSTAPVTELVRIIDGAPRDVLEACEDLRHSSGYSIGVGIDRPTETEKCWIYYPEDNTPFYRVTYLSHYSPHIAPPGTTLFLAEVSESAYKPVARASLLEDTIRGLVEVGLMTEAERSKVLATKVIPVEYWYPVPTVNRNRALSVIQPYLMAQGIYSRGRFGAWLYEIGNMDHSTMMGVEFVDHVLSGGPEETWNSAGHVRAGAGR